MNDTSKRGKEFIEQRIEQVTSILESQISKLEEYESELRVRRERLFRIIVSSILKGEDERARSYAREVISITKMLKLFRRIKLALEAIMLRLETVREIKDVIGILKPITGVINGIRRRVRDILPEISDELLMALSLLQDIIAEPIFTIEEEMTEEESEEEIVGPLEGEEEKGSL